MATSQECWKEKNELELSANRGINYLVPEVCGGLQYICGDESEASVWLTNHIYRHAASYTGTDVSEGDQSLGKPELSVVPQERQKGKYRAGSPVQEAILTAPRGHSLLSWEGPSDGPCSTWMRTRVANRKGTAVRK